MSKVVMSWADRFAMIDHYNPSDSQICTTYGLSQDELDTARTLRAAGSMRASRNMDVSKYGDIFSAPTGTFPTNGESQTTIRNARNLGGTTTHAMPETASRRIKPPQKRGRKGDKITRALQAVPLTRVSVEEFMAQHDVSLAVLRQSKRFIEKLDAETQTQIGKINVRQDKESKTLMIWREMPTA